MFAFVAQLAEQLICNQQVIGSSPFEGSKKKLPDCDGSIKNRWWAFLERWFSDEEITHLSLLGTGNIAD